MNIHDVLLRPLVTEKTTSQLNGDATYAFEVGLAANKIQIKAAVEAFYGVKVADVRTIVVRGKLKRAGRHIARRGNWKKAYVRLVPGAALNLYDV
jgi:large subunit ribosomal protein L23